MRTQSARRPLSLLAPPILLATLAGLAGAAQEALTPEVLQQEFAEPSQKAEETELARSARRILHLAAGGTLTGVARFVDGPDIEGHWEIKGQGGAWREIPAEAVTRAPKEADVLREMKRRRADAHAADGLHGRVELMRWMLEEGLNLEALREADGLLDRAPNHAPTLALLRERSPVSVPPLVGAGSELDAAIDRILRFGAGAPPAARELAIAELEGVEDRERLEERLLEELGNFALRRRVFAAHALGRLFPGEDARRLLQHAVLDSSADVRRQAAQALGNAEQPGLIVPVARALNSQNARVRTQAAEALGFMGYPAAVEPLVSYIAAAQASGTNRVPHSYIFVGKQTAYVQDFDVEVATFQAVADPQINVLLEGDVLDAGVSGVIEYDYVNESRAARKSLGRLTGEDAGNTGASWRRWWEKNAASWRNADLRRDEAAKGI